MFFKFLQPLKQPVGISYIDEITTDSKEVHSQKAYSPMPFLDTLLGTVTAVIKEQCLNALASIPYVSSAIITSPS